jgi:hypothetical protein
VSAANPVLFGSALQLNSSLHVMESFKLKGDSLRHQGFWSFLGMWVVSVGMTAPPWANSAEAIAVRAALPYRRGLMRSRRPAGMT